MVRRYSHLLLKCNFALYYARRKTKFVLRLNTKPRRRYGGKAPHMLISAVVEMRCKFNATAALSPQKVEIDGK